jgi:hypothetical protein
MDMYQMCNRELSTISAKLMNKTAKILRLHGAKYYELDTHGYAASCTMGIGSFPGVESCRGVTLTPHPLLVPRSKNRVQLYIYSP